MEKLEKLISQEYKELYDAFNSEGSKIHLISEICRELDYLAATNMTGYEKNLAGLLAISQLGFPELLKFFYEKESFLGYLQPGKFNSENGIKYLLSCGKIMLAKQYLDFQKADLIELTEKNENEFEITFINENSTAEYFENKALSNYLEFIKNSFRTKKDEHMKSYVDILKKMNKLVKRDKRFFIKYDSNREIENFYSKLGYYHLIENQLCDPFLESAMFGGIEFKKYLDVLEDLIGTALKHRDSCLLLKGKCPDISLRDILCIPIKKKVLIPEYSEYLYYTESEINQIFDCLTVDSNNIAIHSQQLKSFSPPFIKLTDSLLLKSIHGTLHSPLIFLLTELKRRYPDDYFKNINSREGTMRNELYENLSYKFPDRFITIEKEINIKIDGIRTDIDAIIYDAVTGSLALIQIKWQDIFAYSMKDRRNRATNLYPKANEWVDKMSRFTESKSYSELLKVFKINSKNKNGKIYLFVINRLNSLLTGYEPDQRAAWGSWYYILELLHKDVIDYNDPIKGLFLNLRENSPLNKSHIPNIGNMEFKFQNFKIYYNSNK